MLLGAVLRLMTVFTSEIVIRQMTSDLARLCLWKKQNKTLSLFYIPVQL